MLRRPLGGGNFVSGRCDYCDSFSRRHRLDTISSDPIRVQEVTCANCGKTVWAKTTITQPDGSKASVIDSADAPLVPPEKAETLAELNDTPDPTNPGTWPEGAIP